MFDSELAPTVRALKDEVPGVETFVQVVDAAPRAEDIPGPDYESFLASAPPGEAVSSVSAGARHLAPHAEGAIPQRAVIGRTHEVATNPEEGHWCMNRLWRRR